MNRILAATAFTCYLVATPGIAASADIVGVKILDADFKVVAELARKPDVRKFQKHWSQKLKIKQTSAQLPDTMFSYKLDISGTSGGGRWLYNSNGFVVKLDKMARPVYQIQEPALFNELIGIPRK